MYGCVKIGDTTGTMRYRGCATVRFNSGGVWLSIKWIVYCEFNDTVYATARSVDKFRSRAERSGANLCMNRIIVTFVVDT